MIFTFQDIVSHYSNKNYPCINQAHLIANKYKQLYGKDIEPTQELFLLENIATMFRPTDRYRTIDYTTEENIEVDEFERRIKQLKKLRGFLKKLGIDKRQFLYIYDYENIVISVNHSNTTQIAISFQYPRLYLLFFEKEHYNFIRLAYEHSVQQNNPIDYINLVFDFNIKIEPLDYNF